MPLTKLTIEDVLRIKIMARFKMPQRQIAEQIGCSEQHVSNILHEHNYKNVKVYWHFTTTIGEPIKHCPARMKTLKHERYSAGPCLACEKLLIDGIGDPLIYLVRTEDGKDGYVCDEKCQAVWSAKDE